MGCSDDVENNHEWVTADWGRGELYIKSPLHRNTFYSEIFAWNLTFFLVLINFYRQYVVEEAFWNIIQFSLETAWKYPRRIAAIAGILTLLLIHYPIFYLRRSGFPFIRQTLPPLGDGTDIDDDDNYSPPPSIEKEDKDGRSIYCAWIGKILQQSDDGLASLEAREKEEIEGSSSSESTSSIETVTQKFHDDRTPTR